MINYNKIRIMSSNLGVPEEVIEKDYFIDLFLISFSKNNYLKERLIFRGGTVLKKIYFKDYRFSEDLDFLTAGDENLKKQEEELNGLLLKIISEYPIHIDKRVYYENDRIQFYIIYNLIPEIKTVKELKIDICKDQCILSFKKSRVLSLHKEFNEENIIIKTYELEAIVSEKIGRILDNINETRDLYDIWFILKTTINPKEIKKQFKNKYGYDIPISSLLDAILREEYKRTWKIRLAYQVVDLPDYMVLVKELQDLIKLKLK